MRNEPSASRRDAGVGGEVTRGTREERNRTEGELIPVLYKVPVTISFSTRFGRPPWPLSDRTGVSGEMWTEGDAAVGLVSKPEGNSRH